MTIHRLLIGMDFSETAIDAAKWARQHFAADAAITLVHIIGLPDQPPFVRNTLPEPAVADLRKSAHMRYHKRDDYSPLEKEIVR